MENQIPNGKREMEEELMRGRDMANLLLQVLVDDNKSNINYEEEEKKGSKLVLPIAEDLGLKVLKSFTNTLLLLNSSHYSNHVSPSSSITTNCSKIEGCNKANIKNRRGCYKRKLTNGPTWEKDSSILIEDGHAWRKYGQKLTSNAKYLRSYYRCTHKYDQDCQAIKQVQRIQEHPPLYRTTYYGHHKCKSTFNPEIILESASSSSDCSTLLSFNSSLPRKHEDSFSSSSPLAPTKPESLEVIHNDHIAQNQLPSTSENLLLYDYEFHFDYSSRHAMLSSIESNDHQFDHVYDEQFGF